MHDELFDKYLSGTLTREEADHLVRLLNDDPRVGEALAAYVRETGLIIQVASRLEAEGTRRIKKTSTRSIPTIRARKSSCMIPVVAAPPPAAEGPRRWAIAVAAVAAVALAALLLSSLKTSRPSGSFDATSAEARGTKSAETAVRPPVSPIVRVESEKSTSTSKKIESEQPKGLAPVELPVASPKNPAPDSTGAKKPVAAPPPPAPPSPAPVAKPSGDTATVIGYVERAEGQVFLTGSKTPAKHGQSVVAGQGIETRDAKSRATIKYKDGSQFFLEGETVLSEIAANGSMISLARGSLSADVMKQPAGQPIVIRTPQGRADVLGTRLTLVALPLETRLYVQEGRVRLTREADRTWAEVKAGYYAVAGPGILLQAKPQDKSIDQAKIDAAIRKGIEFLKQAPSPTAWEAMGNSDELILWTFLHAGVSEGDPAFQKLLRPMLERKMERTYKVALQAMILEELDRVKYQARICQCAQFLVDNQCRTGQWSYGDPDAFAMEPPTISKDVSTAERPTVREFGDPSGERRAKPKVVRKIPIKKMREGPGAGDNSNSQYAALGLRACFDAGIILPKETILLAKKWWVDNQHPGNDGDVKGVATGGPSGPARGWCYCANATHKASGSMTAGAVGSLSIYDYILDLDWKKSTAVASGMNWLIAHFSVTDNPGHGPPCREAGSDEKSFYLYFMYGLERAGMLYGTEKMGPHWWYPEGARVLVERQAASGAWEDAYQWNKPEWNTCFAILFLRRATRPLDVASEDKMHLKK